MRSKLPSTLLLILLFSSTLAAQAPDQPKPSSYAPAADLIRQVNAYVESLTAATSDADAFDEDKQGEVNRDANTLAAMALVLGMHDQDNALKPAASKLIAAANKLADSSSDAKAAKEAVAAIKAIVDKPEKGEPVSWKPCAQIPPLMKQVPIVNNNLRRGVDSRRFAQSADKNAALAATLAAIAQASLLDTDYVSSDDDRPIWIKASEAMRDGSAEAIVAIRKGDQPAAKAAMDKIVKSCDDCHHKFRPEPAK